MKPLKDIGLQITAQMDPHRVVSVELSLDERRELVREAVTQYEKFRAEAEARQMEKRTRNDWVAIFLEGLGL